METIKAGDILGIGGVVAVAPERCGRCGKPATSFEARRAADPRKSRVDGYCDECAARREARSRWLDGLSLPDRHRVLGLETQIAMTLDRLAEADDLTPRQIREAEASLARERAALAALRVAHGAPDAEAP